MKKITILLTALLFSFLLQAQESAFITAMEDELEAMGEAKSFDDWQEIANAFERIGAVETDEWLPGYYASFAYILMSFRHEDEDTRDGLLDKAQIWMDKLKEAYPTESEIHAMQGFVLQARIPISPMLRGMTYSPKAQAALEKAIELNPDNPRAYYLWGQNVLNTPSFFGGGKENACPILLQAKDKYESFERKDSISPRWGKSWAMKMVEGCE